MLPILNVIAVTTFAAALSSRAMEPVLPLVAGDFVVSIATAASLSAAVALTFAFVQPILGAAADMFGKVRLMIICLASLGAANIIGALATSFEMLFLSRILCGIAAGGTFPIALGLTSDLVPTEHRQIALSRVLAGAMTGNLLGSSAAGVIGDLLGWRGVLSILGLLMVVASVVVLVGFRRGGVTSPKREVNFKALRSGYHTILTNPNARVCFTAVFVEGLCILGLFPFVAAFLFELGETRASIPGVVIAAFAVGGLLYTATVSRLLPRFGVKSLMIGGAVMMALQFVAIAFGPRWEVQAVCFSSWAGGSIACMARCRCSPAILRRRRARRRCRSMRSSSSWGRPWDLSSTASGSRTSARPRRYASVHSQSCCSGSSRRSC